MAVDGDVEKVTTGPDARLFGDVRDSLLWGDAPLRCSVGIMAYNEEANIVNAMRMILRQQPTSAEIIELIVVASGCTDRTTELVGAVAEEDPRVRLIVEQQRSGKASAINHFIQVARSPILVMVSADVLVGDEAIEALARHFRDPEIGMVGGRPVPVNDESTFLGHAVHLLWRLHDQIACESPKLGEMVAFRNVVVSVPADTAVDEVSIQARITKLGYRLVYEPAAVVYNRGPSTVGDFMRQRRRIAAGHYFVAHADGYEASTMSTRRIGRVLVRSEVLTVLRQLRWTAGTVALEATARGLGYYDFVRRRPHHVWTAVPTTKHDVAEGIIDLRSRALNGAPSIPMMMRSPDSTVALDQPTFLLAVANGAPERASPNSGSHGDGALTERAAVASQASQVRHMIPTHRAMSQARSFRLWASPRSYPRSRR